VAQPTPHRCRPFVRPLFAIGLSWLLSGVVACLNPRPDDFPSQVDEGAAGGPAVHPPEAADPGGQGDGDVPAGAGAAGGQPNVEEQPDPDEPQQPGRAADAGAADAGGSDGGRAPGAAGGEPGVAD
jgi:hypothetical protein